MDLRTHVFLLGIAHAFWETHYHVLEFFFLCQPSKPPRYTPLMIQVPASDYHGKDSLLDTVLEPEPLSQYVHCPKCVQYLQVISELQASLESAQTWQNQMMDGLDLIQRVIEEGNVQCEDPPVKK